MNTYEHCVHLPLFTGSNRHGGVRRTSQISESLKSRYRSNYFCLDIYSAKTKPIKTLALLVLNILPFLSLVFGSSLDCRQSISAIILLFKIRSYLKLNCIRPEALVFACETCYPGPSLPITHYLQLLNYSTIVFPHNIEYLVPGSVGRFRENLALRSKLFQIEMNVMRNSKKVLTISPFDSAILQCLSVNAELFPYYPSEADLQNIYTVRTSRKLRKHSCSNSKSFLVLGNVHNPPSFEGMSDVLSLISSSKEFKNFNFVVAGYGTDKLQAYSQSNISVLGAVSSSKLMTLLVNCEAALISQSQTTGMLTRLVELNLSMVPVIMASAYLQASNLEKFSIYNASDVGDLLSLLGQDLLVSKPFNYFERPSLPVW